VDDARCTTKGVAHVGEGRMPSRTQERTADDARSERFDTPGRPGEQPLERRPNRLPVVLIAIVALSAMLALSINAFRGSVVYYLTPTEALDADRSGAFRPAGLVVDDTLAFDAATGTVTFEITDGTTTIPIHFEGTAPDTLKDGAEAIAEGTLGTDDVFSAHTVLARCPSKFESELEG
jgi:cytochrome c-type biogenesis protein CcmE